MSALGDDLAFTPLRVARIRKRHRWSQSELAAQVGCSQRSVSYWERGERAPELKYAVRLLELEEYNPSAVPDTHEVLAREEEASVSVRADMGAESGAAIELSCSERGVV